MSLAQTRATTILLYGRTRSGKSTQIGLLAEDIYRRTKKITRLATADRGGVGPIQPYIDLGIIELIEQGSTDPWIFWNKVVRGFSRDTTGKWIAGDNGNVGMFAFESLTAFGDSLMNSMAIKASENQNIGGGANISFQVSGDGESLKISGNNMAHFGVAQNRITDEVWTSQRLEAPYVLWTASVSKDDDQAASGKVLGPQIVGKALTAEVPRWFNLTFRIDAIPAQSGKAERHLLYLGNHMDVTAGNAVGLGNTRTPLDAGELPPTIEPANIVKALSLIEGGHEKALEVIRKRLGSSS